MLIDNHNRLTASYVTSFICLCLSDYFTANFKNIKRKNNSNSLCSKIFAFKLYDNYDKENKLIINYKIKYRIPIITYVTGDALTQSIEYQFSENTFKSLIAIMKSNRSNYNRYHKQSMHNYNTYMKLQIEFGKSLQLLTVRQIVKLMQACKIKRIELPDIHEADWT